MAEDLDLPPTTIMRVVKKALPPNVSISKETKSAFCKAASIFVLYLTSTASEFSRKAKRSTISGADVLSAVEEVEFDEFLDPLENFLQDIRKETEQKKSTKKAKEDEKRAKAKTDDSEAAGSGAADAVEADAKAEAADDKPETEHTEGPPSPSKRKADSPPPVEDNGGEESAAKKVKSKAEAAE